MQSWEVARDVLTGAGFPGNNKLSCTHGIYL